MNRDGFCPGRETVKISGRRTFREGRKSGLAVRLDMGSVVTIPVT